jgi:hypothetical protein
MTAKKLKLSNTPAQKPGFLLRHRRKIALTNWNSLGAYGGGPHDLVFIEHGAELVAAIAAWKQRPWMRSKCSSANGALPKSTRSDAEIDRARADYEKKRKEVIETALQLQEGREPKYTMVILGGA